MSELRPSVGSRVRPVYQQIYQVLAAALPRLRLFDIDDELRCSFGLWCVSHRDVFQSWQQAWNAWTGAQRGRPGSVALSVRYRECRGQLISLWHVIPRCCTSCHGRRQERIQSAAIW